MEHLIQLIRQAPAIAWATSKAILSSWNLLLRNKGLDYIHRLILHEKAHFLWEHLFDDQLKQDWIELGGWYVNPDDDRWLVNDQTD